MSADGAVRAMVGGRRTKVAGAFNRATQALRQTGSAFKPFVYASALDLGYSPMDKVVDEPIKLNIPGSGPWSPKTYTKEFYGTVIERGVASITKHSRRPNFRGRGTRQRAQGCIKLWHFNGSCTGSCNCADASESTLIEMTGAYAGILNQGLAVTPHGITDLRLSGEISLFWRIKARGRTDYPQTNGANLIFMMENVVRTGTGQRARFRGLGNRGQNGHNPRRTRCVVYRFHSGLCGRGMDGIR